MFHHDHIVLLLDILVHAKLRHFLLPLVTGSLRDRDAHGLELAIEERVTVGELIGLNVLAEQKITVFIACDVSLPFSQSRHPGPDKAKLRKVLTAHRV